jgi:hypothetical protein
MRAQPHSGTELEAFLHGGWVQMNGAAPEVEGREEREFIHEVLRKGASPIVGRRLDMPLTRTCGSRIVPWLIQRHFHLQGAEWTWRAAGAGAGTGTGTGTGTKSSNARLKASGQQSGMSPSMSPPSTVLHL